jgi:hypothetical protein
MDDSPSPVAFNDVVELYNQVSIYIARNDFKQDFWRLDKFVKDFWRLDKFV